MTKIASHKPKVDISTQVLEMVFSEPKSCSSMIHINSLQTNRTVTVP